MTTAQDAIEQIRAMQPDPSRFIQTQRGFVDWKFSQVAAYLGYERAREYAETVRRWHDYEGKYKGCLLDITYQDFLNTLNTTQT